MFSTIVFASLIAIISCDAPAPLPSYSHSPAAVEPAVYAFNYAVADDYTGTNFKAGEKRDGYATSGSYSVNLPDGRIQTVTYTVSDAASGYVADVSYSGKAAYPPAKKAAYPAAGKAAYPAPAKLASYKSSA